MAFYRPKTLIGVDGWTVANDTWTYASASTFTVTTDLTTKYIPGTKLKFTQTTAKYAVVASSSYSAPNTTVTIAVNTDYTIANAAITSPYYSYQANPQGYPQSFSYSPALTSIAVGDGTLVCEYTTVGRILKFWFRLTFGSTSSISGLPVIGLPITITAGQDDLGGALCVESGGLRYSGVSWNNDNNSFVLRVSKADATYTSLANASATAPFTWGTGDSASLTVTASF